MRISDWSSDVCSSDLDPSERVVGTVGGAKIRRRDIVKAGLTGASLAAVVGLPAQAQAQSPEFRLRYQSLHVPRTIEWDKVVPRFVKPVSGISNGRIQLPERKRGGEGK